MAKLPSNIDIEKFYLAYVSEKSRSGKELHTCCPFHDDKEASFSINLETGAWKCFAPTCPQFKGGDLSQFQALMGDTSYPLESEDKIAPINVDLVQKHHDILLEHSSILDYLIKKCGYTHETIEKFKLGWDGERIWIPIIENGKIINIRKYSPQAKGTAKVKGVPGRNMMRLWPIENLDEEEIYLFEGEKDTILANQLGLNAVTVTGGAGSFKMEWVILFKDKRVTICYDIDKAGKEGARRVAQIIGRITKEIKVINLPIHEPSNGDFTDYIVIHGKTIDDFRKVVNKAKTLIIKAPSKVKIDKEVHDVSLDLASRSSFFFKRIRSQIIIAGKDLAPYLVPKKIRIRCSMGKKICAFCGIGLEGGEFDRTFDHLSPDILKLINCSDTQQDHAIRDTLNVSGNCMQYNCEIVDAQNIEELKLIPELSFSSESKEYVCRTAYYMGHGIISNRGYDIEAITMPHPQTQYATHLIYHMDESKSGIDKFEVTEEVMKELEVFQV